MRKILIVSFFTFISSIFTSAYSQSWLWGKQGTNAYLGGCEGYSVALDGSNDVYFTGTYNDSVWFGTYPFYYYQDFYLVKYDPNGSILWAVGSKCGWGCTGRCTTADAGGNVYVAGSFADTVHFGGIELYSKWMHTQDVFLVKYNSAGTPQWALQGNVHSNKSWSEAISSSTDPAGNIYLTGSFTDTISIGSDTLIDNVSYAGIFIAKVSPAGNVLWVRQSRSPSNTCLGYTQSVAADKHGHLYVTGYFQDTLVFGKDTVISSAAYSTFIVKYDSTGNIIWAKHSVGGNYDEAYSVATCGDKNFVITGYFVGPMYFGSHTINGDGIFICKFDSSGNALWSAASTVINNNYFVGYSVATDQAENIYAVGGTDNISKTTVQIGFGNDTLTADSALDAAVLVKFDSAGNYKCGSILRSGGDDYSQVATDPTGNYVYVGGDLATSYVVIGPDTLNSSGEYPFVARWDACGSTLGIKNVAANNFTIDAYPNPSNGQFTIESSVIPPQADQSSVEIFNVLGEKVYSQLSTFNSQLSIDLHSKPSGIYFYRVLNNDGSVLGDGKIIIQK